LGNSTLLCNLHHHSCRTRRRRGANDPTPSSPCRSFTVIHPVLRAPPAGGARSTPVTRTRSTGPTAKLTKHYEWIQAKTYWFVHVVADTSGALHPETLRLLYDFASHKTDAAVGLLRLVTCAAFWRCLPGLVTLAFFALRFVAVVSNRLFFPFSRLYKLLDAQKIRFVCHNMSTT
jgi:hypothetical protein